MKFIVSRTDKAGDLILTTPVFRELKKNFPEVSLIAHVRKYTSSIIRLCPWVDEIIIDDDYPNTLALAKKFSSLKPDHIIIVHPSAKVLQASFLARIPQRTGRASNLWQFLLNDRRVQKRSRNEMHEYQYNLNLLEGIVKEISSAPPRLFPAEVEQQTGKQILAAAGLSKPVFLHPGHGGSALNLAPQQYAEIAKNLAAEGFEVAISFGPGEDKLEKHFESIGKVGFIKNVPDLAILAAILKNCRAFIGGSTGPMHLAAAIGIPVLAFFPPLPAMTPVRWGPVGSNCRVLLPEVSKCCNNCTSCQVKPCMSGINPGLVSKWAKEEL